MVCEITGMSASMADRQESAIQGYFPALVALQREFCKSTDKLGAVKTLLIGES